MIFAKEFNILSIQFSIFTPALLFSPNKILGNLMSKFPGTFDGKTAVLPLPPNAPKEIPRLILPSFDEKVKLEISENRVNFFRYLKENDILVDKNSFFKLCSDVYEEYVKCTSAKVGRLALVIVKFLENSSPGLTLAQHFCKENLIEEPFNRPENFEIHSHKKYELAGFEVNSWVRCKSGILKKDNKPIILAEQDINTLSEKLEQNEFSLEQIRSFVEITASEQEAILGKYFPEK